MEYREPVLAFNRELLQTRPRFFLHTRGQILVVRDERSLSHTFLKHEFPQTDIISLSLL